MYKHLSAVFVFASALVAPPVWAQENVERLEPMSAWNLDYAEHSCGLKRLFGTGERFVYLEIRQFAPSDNPSVIVSSPHLDRPRRIRDFALTFLPDSAPNDELNATGTTSEVVGDGILVSTTLLRAEDRAARAAAFEAGQDVPEILETDRDVREREIEAIEVSNLFTDDIILETGSLHPAMEGMRTCLDELVTHWGVDAEAHRSLTREVEPLDQDRWVQPLIRDYPVSALRREQEAHVRVRLTVSTEGRATDCSVQADWNDPIFDETACQQLLRHSRFEPALDADGQPITSYWTTAVLYQIN